MDLQTMRTEVQARGFSHVTSTYIDRWINLTMQDVNNRYPWPYLETSTSGASPVTVSDLGHVLTVNDITDRIPLQWRDIRILKEYSPALSDTGNPRFWYRDGTASNVIRTYPVNANTIEIRYHKTAADLAADGSSPLMPTAFHYILVEGACMRAYRRANELAAAADAAGEVEVGISKMAALLLPPQYNEPTPGEPDAPNEPGAPTPPGA